MAKARSPLISPCAVAYLCTGIFTKHFFDSFDFLCIILRFTTKTHIYCINIFIDFPFRWLATEILERCKST